MSKPYVNTARVDPDLLHVVNTCLHIIKPKAMALCVMTGTVTECYLITSTEGGPPQVPYPIHKISIAPFKQDFRWDTAVWGKLFDFHVVLGMISPARFSFTTRGEGKGDLWQAHKCSFIM